MDERMERQRERERGVKLLAGLERCVEMHRWVREGREEEGLGLEEEEEEEVGLQQQPPPACWPPWLLDSVELVVGCWGPILIPLACVETNKPTIHSCESNTTNLNRL